MKITKIKITDRKIQNKLVEYEATVTIDKEREEKISGNFPAYYLTGDVELKMIDNVICLHIQYPNLQKDFLKDLKFKDFSKLKRKAKDRENTFLYNEEFKTWLKDILVITAKKYSKLPDGIEPMKYFTKTSEFGIFQPMDCYFYLAGINKAHVHYMTEDFGFKTTKAPKEIAKVQAMQDFKKELKDEITKMLKEVTKLAPKIEVKGSTKDKAVTKPIAKNTATKTEAKKTQGQPKGKKAKKTVSVK